MLGLWALFKGLGIWVRVAIVAAILLTIFGAIYFVYHSIKMTGYREAEDLYKPKIQKLEQDLKNANADLLKAVGINATFKNEIDRLGALVRDQNMSIDKLNADAIEAQNRAREALARVAANQKRYSAEIARLQAIVNGPPITEGECEEADSIMRSILRDRMPNSAGATPPAGKRSAEGGGSESAGGSTVHEQGRFAGYTAAYILGLEESQQGTGGGSGGARLASAR